jgi:hypothetical protein
MDELLIELNKIEGTLILSAIGTFGIITETAEIGEVGFAIKQYESTE